jgi:hypothetical protein
LIASQLGRRSANDPSLIKFVCEELRNGKIDDVLSERIWNPVFVPIRRPSSCGGASAPECNAALTTRPEAEVLLAKYQELVDGVWFHWND